jgi:hypothetical protein
MNSMQHSSPLVRSSLTSLPELTNSVYTGRNLFVKLIPG